MSNSRKYQEIQRTNKISEYEEKYTCSYSNCECKYWTSEEEEEYEDSEEKWHKDIETSKPDFLLLFSTHRPPHWEPCHHDDRDEECERTRNRRPEESEFACLRYFLQRRDNDIRETKRDQECNRKYESIEHEKEDLLATPRESEYLRNSEGTSEILEKALMSRTQYDKSKYARHEENQCDIVCECIDSFEGSLGPILIGTNCIENLWEDLLESVCYDSCSSLVIERYEEILIQSGA